MPQSLQAFLRLPCSQIPLPLNSVHLYLCRPWGQTQTRRRKDGTHASLFRAGRCPCPCIPCIDICAFHVGKCSCPGTPCNTFLSAFSNDHRVFPVTGKQNFGINNVSNLDDVWKWLQLHRVCLWPDRQRQIEHNSGTWASGRCFKIQM